MYGSTSYSSYPPEEIIFSGAESHPPGIRIRWR
jgi:hypothetical protein